MSLPKHDPFAGTFSRTDESTFARRKTEKKATLWKIFVLSACAAGLIVFNTRFGLGLLGLTKSSVKSGVVQAVEDKPFDWHSVVPSKTLEWVSCYEKFECARLSVPLDYQSLKDGEAAVALIRLPSDIPRTEKGYLGPILFNPGGPGGPGVQTVLASAERFRSILGDGYDLVGFDPRGVGYTTPTLDVFPSNAEGGLFMIQTSLLVNASDVAVGTLYATAQSMGTIAKERMGDVGQYVSTPVVARDMLSIVKAYGFEKLQYWGFSYGTVLGATFAAMFPDNVGRIILDGVVDSPNYYATLWSNNLRDTDSTLSTLYQACVEAGPLACPLYENSVQKIHDRVQALLDKLRLSPIPFYNSSTGAYGQVDYSIAKTTMFRTLYKPHATGKALIFALADLERGVAEPLYTLSIHKIGNDLITEPCSCPSAPDDLPRLGVENTLAIACSDGDPVADNVEQLKTFYDKMAEGSSFAECWWPRMGCSGWKIKAKERFTASFEANTSFPLLFIGNTADPVTPLWNAHKMSRGFKGSAVLTQDSPGHCSTSAVSLCTAKVIRDYFQDGKLPVEGTICDVQSSVFGEKLSISNLQDLSPVEWDMLQASHALQQNYFVPII